MLRDGVVEHLEHLLGQRLVYTGHLMVRLGNRYLRPGAFESNHHVMLTNFQVQGVGPTQTTPVRIAILCILRCFEHENDGWGIVRRVNEEEWVDRRGSESGMVAGVHDGSDSFDWTVFL